MMDNVGVDPFRGIEAIPGAPTGQPVPPAQGKASHDAPQPIPGLHSFDHVELSAGPRMVEAYAKFTVHPDSGVVSIKIIDSRTDTVIREIPPDEVVRMAEQLQAYLEARQQRR